MNFDKYGDDDSEKPEMKKKNPTLVMTSLMNTTGN